jgi:2-polyprenyl-3-methyl-5-hydroxy-6-metoxy-1,4-benzoquinol methylase
MAEFWEEAFKNKQEMWGFEPSKSTLLTFDFFQKQNLKNILIPGIGYGRNAQLFRNAGMKVTGIEISKTAIALAHQHFGKDLLIHHGSVTKMPFDEKQYDGIYAYALIHLLDKAERKKFIQDCYNQLAENGWMAFAMVSKKAAIYRQGAEVDTDCFEVFEGVNMFFYDTKSIQEEFGKYGIVEVSEVIDVYPFYLVICKKS